MDGTLLQAWASRRSFKEKPDPPNRGTGARGRKLLRDTHESTTDPEARLYRKSSSGAVVPSYLGHVITENRNGLIVAAMATEAGNAAERQAALKMVKRLKPRQAHHAGCRQELSGGELRERAARPAVTPHVAEYEPNPKWPNWLTEAERNDPGLAVSQKKRKLVEKVFGWMKQDRLRQIKLRGLKRVDWLFQLAAAAHNLLRMSKLIPIPAQPEPGDVSRLAAKTARRGKISAQQPARWRSKTTTRPNHSRQNRAFFTKLFSRAERDRKG